MGLFEDMARMGMRHPDDDDALTISSEEQIHNLQDFVLEISTPTIFKKGDIITQKDPPYKTYVYPKMGTPAIVVDLIDDPTFGGRIKDISTADKNDIIIAVYVKDNLIKTFEAESCRFERYQSCMPT